MPDPTPDRWTETTTGRERVRTVVETLDDPATVTEIADAADVAWETANSELERLQAENQVAVHEADGRTEYGPNPVRQFVDQVLALIDEHDRDELEDRLVTYQERLEALQEEHEARDASDLRERLADDGRSAAELRELRSVAETWAALQTERRLTQQALNFYADVARLSGSDDESSAMRA